MTRDIRLYIEDILDSRNSVRRYVRDTDERMTVCESVIRGAVKPHAMRNPVA